MDAAHAVAGIEIRQGACDPQDAVVAAGREAQAVGGLGQQAPAVRVGRGDLLQQLAVGLGVGLGIGLGMDNGTVLPSGSLGTMDRR